MAMQKKPAYITEKKPFPTMLRKLMEETKTTQAALAKAIGMTRQGVALYASGQTMPDIETFVKIADFFGVSFDYLLGRSEAMNREYHSATEQTGLSEKAVKKLASWHESVEEKQADGVRVTRSINTKAPEEISRLIENKKLHLLIAYIRSLRYIANGGGDGIKIKNSVLGPAKVKALKDEIGKNETREYIMFLIMNTFRDMVNEIIPFTPVEDEVRQATQADMDDFF